MVVPKRKFLFNGVKLPYFLHKWNLTWTNERIVEIPIIMDYIKNYSGKRILEVGAVLPHYFKLQRDVLDKFEKGEGIINQDIREFKPEGKYDLIVTISTLEHVGFDDDVKDSKGTSNAIKALKQNCLANNGKLVVTLPIGYSKELDKQIFSGELGFDEEYYLKRKNMFRWNQVSKQKARTPYAFLHANSLLIGVVNNSKA